MIPLKSEAAKKIASWRRCIAAITTGHPGLVPPRNVDPPSVQSQPRPPPYRPRPALPTATLKGTRVEVPIRRSHGGFIVDGVMNGTRRASFTIDLGATNVVIPRDIIVAMVREGTVTKADYVGPIIHTFANGRAQQLEVVRLKSLTVGGRTVQNVLCSAGDGPQVFLLGQSFLSKLTSWSIDNARGHSRPAGLSAACVLLTSRARPPAAASCHPVCRRADAAASLPKWPTSVSPTHFVAGSAWRPPL